MKRLLPTCLCARLLQQGHHVVSKPTVALSVACVLALAGCGPGSVGGGNDGVLLDAAHFSGTALYPLHFSSVDAPEDPVIVAFEAAKEVGFSPTPAGAPWAIFTAGGQEHQDGTWATLPIGERTIGSRTEMRSWKDGAVEHFAETITYTLEPSDVFKKLGLPSMGPFSLRLLAENDPAVGHWVVTSGQFDPNQPLTDEEKRTVDQQLVYVGQNNVAHYEKELAQAKNTAYADIAERLAADGTLAKDPNAGSVSFSRNNGLAYYTGPQPLSEPSVQQMEAFCKGLKTPGYHGWRLGSLDELKALQKNDDSKTFIDTPDHKLLGALAWEPNGDKSAAIWTGTTSQMNVYGALYNPLGAPPPLDSTSQLQGVRTGGGYINQQISSPLAAGSGWNTTPIKLTDGFSEQRVFCVAPLKH